jgi:carboxymethylenebutenolidase
MDGFAIRPVMWEMARRLADGGYLVLLPDLYYRIGHYLPMIPSKTVADPKLREEFLKLLGSLNRDKKISDAGAFIDFLLTRPEVKGDRFAAIGYCMGGNVALTAAGAFSGRFEAVASFHGGHLATDKPDSPHRFVKNISGRVYIAGAVEDASFSDQQKELLEQALTDAGVEHLIETYTGARHGFAVPDHPVFDADAAERHWAALFKLLEESFAPGS